METIKSVARSLEDIFRSYFSPNMDVMSDEAKKIFSNEDDKRKYIEAVEKLKNSKSKEETITLSTNETITLIS